MKKRIKFTSNLIPLILSGEKVSTWRLWDDKGLKEGDIVDFTEFGTDIIFATAKLTKVVEKFFKDLTEDDKVGHEKFASDEEMYKVYEKYYGYPVNRDSIVKIIWFELI